MAFQCVRHGSAASGKACRAATVPARASRHLQSRFSASSTRAISSVLVQGLQQVVRGAEFQRVGQGFERRMPRNEQDLAQGFFRFAHRNNSKPLTPGISRSVTRMSTRFCSIQRRASRGSVRDCNCTRSPKERSMIFASRRHHARVVVDQQKRRGTISCGHGKNSWKDRVNGR